MLLLGIFSFKMYFAAPVIAFLVILLRRVRNYDFPQEKKGNTVAYTYTGK